MFEKLKALAARLDELEIRLSAPDLYDDPDDRYLVPVVDN